MHNPALPAACLRVMLRPGRSHTSHGQGTPMTDRLPAAECASWCKSGDGHGYANDPADQHCESPPRTVPLARHPLLGVGAEPRERDHLVGLIHREAHASVPHISIKHNDAMIDLSIEDARRLAAELLTLAEAATT